MLLVRPRGWHLEERHVARRRRADVAGRSSTSASTSSTTHASAERAGPYFYLPKLESHLEARLWNDVFAWPQERLGRRRAGTIKATVLIETILAAFEMDEILYELREHSAGSTPAAGTTSSRASRSSAHRPEFVLPDRAQVTMTVPFMRAYTRAPRQDLPPPRRARDGRHGGVHPLPARRRGERQDRRLWRL